MAPGSAASGIQSWIENVQSGSCFAGYQSLGARGLTSVQPIVVAAFIVGNLSAILSLIILLR